MIARPRNASLEDGLTPISPQLQIRFGTFEVDCAAGELRKGGIRVKLHEKPFQLLLALLERPGEVVTRKELQEWLWPGQTFVEFENGLNNAISRLREALGDTAENPRFIETIPRHGYRFLAEVAPSLPKHGARIPRGWLITAAVVLAAVVVGLFLRLNRAQAQPIRSVAVLPFRNLGTVEQDDYFAAGMTDAVTTDLAELSDLKVVSETSVARFKNTKQTIPEIARTLGVDAVVEGAVLQEGDRVRITVQLIRASTDRHIWADSYERQLTNILALQDHVAQGVANAVNAKLSPALARIASPPRQVNASAYQAYLEGYYYEQNPNDDFPRAKGYLEQAIQLDPSFAPAYAGLSDYYCKASDGILPPEEVLPKCGDYAEQALRLDSNLPEGHLALANFYTFNWNWSSANQEYQSAITLAPGLAPAHEWYATYLDVMGRKAESLREARRAVELDPLYPHAHDTLAAAAFLSGEYGLALEECHQILELDPSGPLGHACVAQDLMYTGKFREAINELNKVLALTHRDPDFLSWDAIAYVHLGQMQQANKLMEEIKTDSKRQYISPGILAEAFAAMGKEKEAMDDLDECYKLHDAALVTLKINPFWNPLRGDPRFQKLLREMNFPPSFVSSR